MIILILIMCTYDVQLWPTDKELNHFKVKFILQKEMF